MDRLPVYRMGGGYIRPIGACDDEPELEETGYIERVVERVPGDFKRVSVNDRTTANSHRGVICSKWDDPLFLPNFTPKDDAHA